MNAKANMSPAARNARSERYGRVRLVRYMTKWLVKLDGMAADITALRGAGVRPPSRWKLDNTVLLAMTNEIRSYLVDAIATATEEHARPKE